MPAMREIKFEAVLFDMDGVILDSMQYHARIWQELLDERGFNVPISYILENEGCLGPEALMDYLGQNGGLEGSDLSAPEGMERLLALQAEIYLKRYAPRVKPFDGAADLLADLAQAKIPTALVTSSRRSVMQGCLGPELMQGFEVLVCAEDVAAHKPDPEPYLKAAAALNKEASRCLVVENAPAGIESALAAGATCFGVLSTLTPAHLGRAHALFKDLHRLREALGLAGLAKRGSM